MQEGSEFDLVTASGDASLRLISSGTVQPINLDLIPSYDTVDERLQDAPWHTVDGRRREAEHYGVPVPVGLQRADVQHRHLQGQAPDSWNVVFEEHDLPDGKSNKGRVQAYDGPIYIADAALYLKAHKPELGIEDPYALNEEQFEAAVDLLRQQRAAGGPLLARRLHPDRRLHQRGRGGQLDLAVPGEPAADRQGADRQRPSRGGGHRLGGHDDDARRTPRTRTAPTCGWSTRSNRKVQGDLASWFGSVPAVPDACRSNELLGAEGCATNGFDNFDKIAFWKTPQADCFEPTGTGSASRTAQWVTNYVAVIGGR